ncbi:PPOX class F420-dependent enzyme [Actinoplanes sp. OR16]|uniref:PPOX class F420-dependent oxidoreductase n=1 Tax=Actinoplanes sp. OR16 TaxID=946334 RepID=UPI000F7041C9|nr:PPOX class F420-dependent oxidoreductase [Actinoplanes sp. OR16]BBH68413.1 PPOX class F420-dependent enzyme [Actinoplanes sp. OR16]
MATSMSEAQWRKFLGEGTRTGKLATVRADGSPHVVPIWFVLDGDDLVFNTGAGSVKGRNLARDGRASLCVDEEAAPYAFVTVTGRATLHTDLADMLHWSTLIGSRYMGPDRAAEFGARNAVDGELLVRLRIHRVTAYTDISG